MTTKELAKLSLALFVGAALAFPVGMMVGGSPSRTDRAAPAARPRAAGMRDMFSPAIRRDPAFLERQREGVEALERYCQASGESCSEARAARRALAEIELAN